MPNWLPGLLSGIIVPLFTFGGIWYTARTGQKTSAQEQVVEVMRQVREDNKDMRDRVDRAEDRQDKAEERQELAEQKLEATIRKLEVEQAYVDVLVQHISDGKPPPPPGRPAA